MSLSYAACRVLSATEADAILDWLAAPETRPEPEEWIARCQGSASEEVWLLAHCDDGVTWGKVTGHQLALSCEALAGWPIPRPDRTTLQQLRLFGPGGELLLWRSEGAEPRTFAARILDDQGQPRADDPTVPKDELYLLCADRIASGGSTTAGFTAVADRAGRSQVVPLAVDDVFFGHGQYRLGLDVRHYFELDATTGCVSIAASRLVRLRRLAPGDNLIVREEQP